MNSMWVLRTLARRWVGGRAAHDNLPRRARRRPRALPRSVRLAVEALEDRTLLSVLPAPITTAYTDVSHPTGYPGAPTHQDNENTPSIAVDPVSPQHLVAVYTFQDINAQTPSSAINIAYSTDGGQSWTQSNANSQNLVDPTSFGPPQAHYLFATNASVAFDRAHNFYVSYVQSQGPDLTGMTLSGALVVKKFDFSGPAPTAVSFTNPQLTGDQEINDATTQVLYQWAQQDPALNPRLTVDSNLPTYTDPVTGATVTDPHANPTIGANGVATDPNQDQVYVTWNTNNQGPSPNTPSTFNPNTIKIAASSDGGNTFSTQVFVNSTGNFGGDATMERDSLPVLTAAQGVSSDHSTLTSVPGGQLTIAWNNFATNVKSIQTTRITNGGSGFLVDSGNLPPSNQTLTSNIQDAGPTPSGGNANVPMTTTFDLNVQPPAGSNFTVADLDVSIAMVHPNLQQVSIVLVGPDNTQYVLATNHLDAAGKSRGDNPFVGITGANLGMISNGATPPSFHELDTVFDDQAARNITAQGGVAPFTAHFQPEGPGPLTRVNGKQLTDPAVAGTWQLQITDFDNDGSTPPTQFLEHWSLNFTAGLTTLGTTTAATGVQGSNTGNSLGAAMAPFPLKLPSDPSRGVAPTPSLAVDNTLGSFSPYQGRIYLTYTGASNYVPPGLTKPLETDTNVYLVTSDDGGRTWSSAKQVNDDSPGDNFSEGDRSQYEPSAAVDPVTGTLAITFYDARNDPANARVATYLATSIDGGQTFGPETYLNAPKQALDASQFNGDPTTSGSVAVNLGPIPDNQSAGNTSADTTFSFGDHQALAVYGGHVYALWSGNQNGGPRLTNLDGSGKLFTTNLLDILGSVTVIAAGPRVFGQTAGGPVTSGTVFPDGTVAPNSFTVTFDRPVDINSFRNNVSSLVSVVFRSPNTPANNVAPYFGGTLLDPTRYTVTALNAGFFGPDAVGLFNGTFRLATQFRVNFVLQDSLGRPITDPVGTYSYSVGDLNGTGTTIQDDIRPASGVAFAPGTNPGNRMDQNGDAVTDQANVDVYANPRPLGGTPFSLPYDTTTLPLIVPGPHIVRSSVPGQAASSDNLILNNSPNPPPASAIDVVFDRNMDQTTFTTAQLLRLQGPVGAIPLFDSQGNPLPGVGIIPNPNGTDPDPAHPRTFRVTLPTGEYLQTDGSISTNVTPWNILSLNGTYTVTLGAGIKSAAGDLADNNENAGLAVLNGVDPANVNLVPGGISHTSTTPVTIGPNATAQAFITFPEGFLIQHTQVLLNISVADSRDLEGFLISPDGKTVIKLFTNPGAAPNTGKQTGFINTVLDDLASTPIQPNASGNGPAQPLTGTFNPQQPLSSLNNTSSAGQWTLLLQNDSATDTATLTNWKLTFAQTLLGTGLGEPVADQSNVSFRIFSMGENAALPLATWTPVGPAAEGLNGVSGRIGGIAVDPSDPSGNTVYVAGATGGVWKTSNFLTTSGNGPTWIPLTDFGPNSGVNIGGIAVFGRNNDPKQSIVYAVTGDGDGGAGEGVGVIRSLDGGAHWDLLDSLVNVYNPSNDGGNRSLDGQLLPLALRGHELVGTTAFKIVVDPVPNPSTGQPVLFIALSGGRGGIYRSLDGGNTWANVLAGNATDVALAPYSAFDANNPAAPPGNAQIVYAAFVGGGQTGEGVYKSSTEGAFGTWSLMAGQQGGNPLIQTLVMGMPATVGANIPNKLPQGGSGRIVLSVPGLTGTLVPGKPYSGGHPLQDLIQENWVYAAVVGSSSGNSESGGGGKLFGLFMTKDGGNNWTQIHIPYSTDETNPAVADAGSPTNDDKKTDFDPFAGGIFSGGQGNYDISLQVDPNNANVFYLGGTSDGPPWALSRVDTTGISDPYAVVGYDNNDNDGGQLAFPSTGPALPPPGKAEPKDGFGAFPNFGGAPYINLLREPSDPFAADATLFIGGVEDKSKGNAFTNEGSDIAIWQPFGGSGGTDHHRVVAFRDPISGKTRLIFGDDQGLWSSVDDGSGNVIGSLNAGGVRLPSIDRNGNLQIGQLYYGATQPSDLATQIGGALFYANAQDNGFPQSDPNILTDGRIAWSNSGGDGAGIATDQTGSGTVYTYRWPCCGGGGATGAGGTDFFEVNSPNTGGYVSRTTGLIQANNPGAVPDPQWPFLGGSNFAVNPSNGDDIIMSSLGGGGNPSHVFVTGDQGNDWVEVGGPEAARLTPLDGAYAAGVGFGPIDPLDASARPDLDNLYAGTSAGNLYVTVDGGGTWVNVGQVAGVNLGGVSAVSANPRPGTHEAYVVSGNGVFHLTYQVNHTAQGVPFIVNSSISLTPINGGGANNLFALNHVGFASSALYTEPFLRDPAGNAQGLDALAVDWRFAIPDDPANPTGSTHPIVYVGGNGGIFRSEDNGNNWTPYPDSIPTTQLGPDGSRGDGAPVDGGLLPLAQVKDLDLVLGNVNPQTGLPDQSQGPNLLVATTYGRGTFAIRLPLVHPFDVEQTLHVVSAVPTNFNTANNTGGVTPLPNPVNPGVGLDRITVTFNGTVDPQTFPLSAITLSGPGGVIPNSSLRLTDVTNPDVNGSNPHNVWEIDFPHQSEIGTYTLNIAPKLQDLAGRFMDQDLDDTLPTLDPLDVPGTPDSGDGFTGTFLIQGLQVVSASPANGSVLNAPPGLSSVTVTFNAPVDANSFTGADVILTGPTGPGAPVVIPGATVKDITPIGAPEPHSVWEVDLPAGMEKYPGTYTIQIGPNIKDTGDGTGSGNAAEQPMDQDEDSTAPPATTAEAPGSPDDAFFLNYTVPSLFVTAVTPDPTLPVLTPAQKAGTTGLQTMTVTFSRDVNPSTLVPANFVLRGPATSTGPGPVITIPASAITSSTPAGAPANSLVRISLPTAITTPGVYTLTVGTGVTDLNGVPLDQDKDPSTDRPGSNADDAFSVRYSVAGLQVVSLDLATAPQPLPAGQTGVVITFNQAVLAGTVDGNVTVLDPNNKPVVLGTATDLNPGTDTIWKVPFQTPQLTYGTYTVTVGPGVEDLIGKDPSGVVHAMNQNNNTTFGEAGDQLATPAGDAFTATFAVAGLKVTSITPAQSAVQPLTNGLQMFTVTFNMTVQGSTFIPANLTLTGPETLTEPGGVVGPGATIPIPANGITDITPAGQTPGTVWQISLPSKLTTPGIYTLTIGTGVEDLGGNPLDQDEDHYAATNPDANDPDAADNFVAQFDVNGLKVVSSAVLDGTPDPTAPGQMLPGTVSKVRITFNQPVLPSSITVAANDVILKDRKGNAVPLTALVPDPSDTTGTVWDAQFNGAQLPGTYSLTVTTGVKDLGGNALNQNQNTVYGESPGDVYSNSSIFTVTGLRVTSVTPTLAAPVLDPTGLNGITITFNREVDPASFTAVGVTGSAKNLVLVGPKTPSSPGATIPLPVADLIDVTPVGAAYPHSVWKIAPMPALTTPGIYTLTIGPGLTDSTQTAMDQNANLKFGEAPLAPVGDSFQAQFDVDGLAVTSVTPSGPTQLLPGVSSATITFNQPVLPSSINGNDVVLRDPNGTVVAGATVAPVAGDATGTQWQLQFPGQSIPGVYTILVEQNVKDLAGNQMNQNHNTIFGEPNDQFASPPGDEFTAHFSITGLKVLTVTPTLAAPVLDPTGLNAIFVTFNREVDPASFKAADANGNAVNLALTGPATPTGRGANIPIPVADLIDVTPAGAQFAHSQWEIQPTPAVTTAGIYTLTIGPAITDADPSTPEKAMDQNGNFTFGETGVAPAGDAFQAQFDVEGLAVTSVTPSGPTQLPPGVSSATVSFNQAVLASSFTNADIVLTDPNGNPVSVTRVLPAAGDTTGTQWQVQFPGQKIPGVYKLTVLHNVEDLAGNAMNQNHNLVFGETGDQSATPAGDDFTTTFAVTGLKVVSVAPTLAAPVLDPAGLGSATITFNREVAPNSFTAANVVLKEPDGSTVPAAELTVIDLAVGAGDNVWEVDVTPALTTPGIYALTIGPAITDSTGHAMDQNGNFIFGQTGDQSATPAGDQFTAQFDVDGLAVLSVAPAATSVVAPGISSAIIVFNQAVLSSTLVPANIVITDPTGKAVPVTGVAPAPGDTTGTIWQVQFAGQKLAGVYKLTVLHNVEDLAGNAMNQNHNLVFGETGDQSAAPPGDDFTTTFSVVGLEVASVTPTAVLEPPGLGSVTITFNREVNASTFTTADLTLVAPDGSTVPTSQLKLKDLRPTDNGVWELDFNPALVETGNYALTIGPHVADSTGKEMDQNGNFKFGEAGDAFTTTLSVTTPASQAAGSLGNPLSGPVDVTGLVTILLTPPRRRGKRFVQQLVVFNNTGSPIQGPFSLVLLGLPRHVHLLNPSGISLLRAPGNPFQFLFFPNSVLTSFGGGVFTMTFSSPSARMIRYMPVLLVGFGII